MVLTLFVHGFDDFVGTGILLLLYYYLNTYLDLQQIQALLEKDKILQNYTPYPIIIPILHPNLTKIKIFEVFMRTQGRAMPLKMFKSIERRSLSCSSIFCKNKIKFEDQIKIILLMSESQPQQMEAKCSIILRKFSDSSLTDHSDHESSSPTKVALPFPSECEVRWQIYGEGGEWSVSEKMNRRGVSWLLRVGWARGFEQPCIWTAVLLYYAYKSHFPFGKEAMEPIILVCLQLSSKFHESAPLETRDLLLLLSKPIPRQDLRTYEERILQITDFNLVIPHYLSCLADLLDTDNAAKVHFLCDLLLLKDHHIFFDRERVERLVKMVQCSEEVSEQDTAELREMMTDKQSRILHNKYGSKFDTDAFVSSFCATY